MWKIFQMIDFTVAIFFPHEYVSIWLSPRNFSASLLFRQRHFSIRLGKEGVPRVSPFGNYYLSLSIGISKNEDFDYVSLKFPMANLHNGQNLVITLEQEMQL